MWVQMADKMGEMCAPKEVLTNSLSRQSQVLARMLLVFDGVPLRDPCW